MPIVPLALLALLREQVLAVPDDVVVRIGHVVFRLGGMAESGAHRAPRAAALDTFVSKRSGKVGEDPISAPPRRSEIASEWPGHRGRAILARPACSPRWSTPMGLLIEGKWHDRWYDSA